MTRILSGSATQGMFGILNRTRNPQKALMRDVCGGFMGLQLWLGTGAQQPDGKNGDPYQPAGKIHR
tara:strand:+ start:135 stop:332 length:198 start_codon:yes stop_codon:yes gene_type:complete